MYVPLLKVILNLFRVEQFINKQSKTKSCTMKHTDYITIRHTEPLNYHIIYQSLALAFQAGTSFVSF